MSKVLWMQLHMNHHGQFPGEWLAVMADKIIAFYGTETDTQDVTVIQLDNSDTLTVRHEVGRVAEAIVSPDIEVTVSEPFTTCSGEELAAQAAPHNGDHHG